MIMADFDTDGFDELLLSRFIVDEDLSTIHQNITGQDDYFVTANDINGDNEIDIIATKNGSTKYYFSGLTAFDLNVTCIINTPPVITSAQSDTGNPICTNTTVTFTVDVNDAEDDLLRGRADCYGNGSFTDYSLWYFDTVFIDCNYTQQGSFNSILYIEDECGATDSAQGTVQILDTNCNSKGEGITPDFGGGTPSETAQGWDITLGEDVTDGYTSTYFDFSVCSTWLDDWRAIFIWFCPVYALGIAILTTLFNWIFSAFFGIALLIVLIVIIVVAVRRRTVKG
jgi:hypothetical protein